MPDWYVSVPEREPVGPVDGALVVQGILVGQVPLSARVCLVGASEWMPLSAVREFAVAIRQVAPPPPSSALQRRADPTPAAPATQPPQPLPVDFPLDYDDKATVMIGRQEPPPRSHPSERHPDARVQGPMSDEAFGHGGHPEASKGVPPVTVVAAETPPPPASAVPSVPPAGSATDEPQFYVATGLDDTRGPYGLGQLLAMRAAGDVPPEAVVLRVGTADWKAVDAALSGRNEVPRSGVPVRPAPVPLWSRLKALPFAARLAAAACTAVVLSFLLVFAISTGEKGRPVLEACQKAEAEARWGDAIRDCEQAMAIDPESVSARAASERLPSLKAKAKEAEARLKAQAEAEAKAAAEAAARRAAEAEREAKCKRWMTVCTLGRWPDGSERTTGMQTFSSKAQCEDMRSGSGLRCDSCSCWN